jgi:hypothetical protein
MGNFFPARILKVAHLQDASAGGEFEDLMEGVGEEVFVFAAELADRIVIGMGIAGEEAHGGNFSFR